MLPCPRCTTAKLVSQPYTVSCEYHIVMLNNSNTVDSNLREGGFPSPAICTCTLYLSRPRSRLRSSFVCTCHLIAARFPIAKDQHICSMCAILIKQLFLCGSLFYAQLYTLNAHFNRHYYTPTYARVLPCLPLTSHA